jgi:hypothetical protein
MNGIIVVIYLAVIIGYIAGMWKTFEKAGQPGWAAIVPIYNIWILTKIAGKEPLYFVLCLIPCVNIVGIILVSIGVAEKFGKSQGYGVGLALLGFVFYPMLGFGEDRYQDSTA